MAESDHPSVPDTRRGEAARANGDAEAALAEFRALLTLCVDSLAGHLGAAAALLALNRPLEALSHYDAALAIRPDSWVAHYGRGAVLQLANRRAEALHAYDKALLSALDPTMIQVARGDLLLTLSDPRGALSAFESAIAQRPNLARALTGRGAALVHLDRFEEAKAVYLAALGFDPDSPEAHAGLGCVLLAEARSVEALDAFDRAVRSAPMSAKAHWGRGEALLLLEDPTAALAAFDRALQIEPELTEAHSGRSRTLAVLGAPLADLLEVEARAADDAVEAAASRAPFGNISLAVRFAESLSGQLMAQAFARTPDGRGGRKSPLSLDDLLEAAAKQALVYVLPSRDRPGAIVIGAGKAEWVDLPGLTASALRDRRAALLRTYNRWRGPGGGVRFTPAAHQPNEAMGFAQALEDCAHWLWSAGVGTIVQAVEQAGLTRCAFVLGARLSLMPLAAARGPDGRYAAERLVLTQTPNGASWREGIAAERSGRLGAVTIIIPKSAPDGACSEGIAFAERLSHETCQVIRAGFATRAAFVEAFLTSDLLYFVGHAAADLQRPLEGKVDLDDGALSIEKLARLVEGRHRPRWVILAGCETGLVGHTLPPAEPIAFPALMNMLGVAGVVSAQWLLLDTQTQAVMGSFREELLCGRPDAALALASAQRAAIQGRFDVSGLQAHLQPSHPFCWAALYLSGA